MVGRRVFHEGVTVFDSTLIAPVRPAPLRSSETLLRVGPVQLTLSDDVDDIEAACRLRYSVFAAEPGFGAAIGDVRTGTETDRFDEHCRHLIVRHDEDGVIGCARLLTPERAIAAGGWYGATEFDLGELDAISPETVEMGRACIAPGHRAGSVAALMWAGLLGHVETIGHRYVMGCVSVPVDSGTSFPDGADLRAIRDELRNRHRGRWQVYPHRHVCVGGRGLDDIEPADPVVMPALMRGYLRLGATVCGEPAHDADFGVGDFLTVLDRRDCNERYVRRLRDTVARLTPAGEG